MKKIPYYVKPERDSLLAELNRIIEKNIDTGGVVIAAGMAEYEEKDSLVEEVFHRADQRMYARKKQLKEIRENQLKSYESL